MGSHENQQKAAKGENAYESQLSHVSVVLRREREEHFGTFFGDTPESKGLFNTSSDAYCLFWLKPDRIFRSIFQVALWSEVGQIRS